MRRLAIIGVGLASVVALASGASAADLPAKVYTKAPPAVAPIYNWSGFYIGLNGGGGFSHNCWTRIPEPTVPTGCHDATGGLAGGQIGYRWQATNWVFGVEAQGDWANLKGSGTSTFGTFGGLPFSNQTSIDAIGMFTGQAGYAWNNVLLYLKGGAAFTHDKYGAVSNFIIGNVPAGTLMAQASETRWGGVVGTGIEFGFAPGWSVAVEYDHLFMGNGNRDFVGTPVTGGGFIFSRSITQDVDMGTVRVNYTFGAPVVAKY